MGHLPNLITDLALILGAAAISTIIFKWLKQPLVLGYIIAGFVVGPYFHLTPTVVDRENIETLAEIGVIFLLFSLGLEFSFKKLLRVGGSASITALVEILFITVAGYFVGQLMGWTMMDSLFLGGMLASSSTTIILRAFDELGVKTKKFAGIVFGVLIVEDIVVILVMVLLSTVAVTRAFEGSEMLLTVLKLLFFLVLWFLAGIFLLPTFLKKAKKLMSEEMLLILSLALCLGMVVLATYVGFSAELGAFVMGSIIAETTSAEKVEHLLKPVKDLFGAIFFTSVGMMIDPQAMVDYAQPIFWITMLTLLGKLFSTTLGALLSGQPLKQSVQVGMSMAQIGEFAFIVAALGLSLGVTSAFLFPVAVGASAITTFTTPYLIKSSGALAQWLERVLPKGLLNRINRYSTETKMVSYTSEWKKFIRSAAINAVLLSIVILSIIFFSSRYVQPWIQERGDSLALKITAVMVTLLALTPFLWALAIKSPTEVNQTVIANSRYKGLLYTIRFLKLGLAAFFIGFLLDRYFSMFTGIAFTAIFIALLILLSERIRTFYSQIEHRFFSNLNQREIAAAQSNRTELAPWDAHIAMVEVEPSAPIIGKSLLELRWRETIGINVVMIKRGDHPIAAPGKDQLIFPSDHLLVLGTDHQIQRLKASMRPQKKTVEEPGYSEVTLHKHFVDNTSPLRSLSIRQTGLREKAGALVVGIERNNERLLNPESELILQEGDTVFIVGNKRKLFQTYHMDLHR
ncbi:cation:proton antiporter [Flavisolibacter tropicus]|uniref:Sodium:proton antiporter n=1 Tax=Flavisolibacter tropicus TaxID=1492898 RepID=A0A172TZX7_9BACT|nr:cation:proton antiporter [Flavisolibacter tropicus]ANE52333.1 sodium:proton antiporter [Flavisolibacter tropicus]